MMHLILKSQSPRLSLFRAEGEGRDHVKAGRSKQRSPGQADYKRTRLHLHEYQTHTLLRSVHRLPAGHACRLARINLTPALDFHRCQAASSPPPMHTLTSNGACHTLAQLLR